MFTCGCREGFRAETGRGGGGRGKLTDTSAATSTSEDTTSPPDLPAKRPRVPYTYPSLRRGLAGNSESLARASPAASRAVESTSEDTLALAGELACLAAMEGDLEADSPTLRPNSGVCPHTHGLRMCGTA